MIEPIAAQVNVGKEDIYANTFLWDAEGTFTGHLETEPTSRAGGKAKVVADLKAEHGAFATKELPQPVDGRCHRTLSADRPHKTQATRPSS